MIVNGVTLPDIPAEVLEQYPYAVMFHRDETDGWVLAVAVSEYAYLLGDLIDTSMEGIRFVTSSGAGASFSCYQDSTAWNQTATHEAGENLLTIGAVNLETGVESTTMAVVWANHDIYKVTSIDFSTGEFVTGEIYFPNSEAEEEPEETKPPRYSIATAILDAVARQIMRLTDSTKKVKPEEFEPKLEGINIQLQELTVTATEEVQTITPPSGVYGFSKVIVEAVEDSGTGGGGGTPGEGGEGGEDGDQIHSGDFVGFGNEYVEEEVETGMYQYPSGFTVPPLPAIPGGGYKILIQRSSNVYRAFVADGAFSRNGYYLSTATWPIKIYGYTVDESADWEYIGEDYTEIGLSSYGPLVWTSHDIGGNWPMAASGSPTPETVTTIVKKPVEYDAEYKISGESLNNIITLAQDVTGTKEPMTLDEAYAALDKYFNPEPTE